MNQPAKAQEPSMEEILASIRRIIADDDAAKPQPKPPLAAVGGGVDAAAAPARPAPSGAMPEPGAMTQADIDAMLAGVEQADEPVAPQTDESAILDLTEDMATEAAAGVEVQSGSAAGAGEPEAFEPIAGESDVVFAEGSEPETPEVQAEPEPRHPSAAAAAVPPRREPAPEDDAIMSPVTRASVDTAFNSLAHAVLAQNARTLEDIVKEMLRPMLRTWLDDNLPGLVERLVRAEIERVSRGRS